MIAGVGTGACGNCPRNADWQTVTAGRCCKDGDTGTDYSFTNSGSAYRSEPNRRERRRSAMLARLGDRASKHSLRKKWQARA